MTELRADPVLRETPVIVLTAWLADDLKRRARDAGASAVLVKPYDEAALLAELRAAFQES